MGTTGIAVSCKPYRAVAGQLRQTFWYGTANTGHKSWMRTMLLSLHRVEGEALFCLPFVIGLIYFGWAVGVHWEVGENASEQ